MATYQKGEMIYKDEKISFVKKLMNAKTLEEFTKDMPENKAIEYYLKNAIWSKTELVFDGK